MCILVQAGIQRTVTHSSSSLSVLTLFPPSQIELEVLLTFLGLIQMPPLPGSPSGWSSMWNLGNALSPGLSSPAVLQSSLYHHLSPEKHACIPTKLLVPCDLLQVIQFPLSLCFLICKVGITICPETPWASCWNADSDSAGLGWG